MGIPLSREGPPSAVAAPSEAATPVGCEEHKHPLQTGTPRGSQLQPGGKPGAASEWEKEPPPAPGTRHTPVQSTAWGALAGNLLTSHLRLGFREWTEVTSLLRPTEAQVNTQRPGRGQECVTGRSHLRGQELRKGTRASRAPCGPLPAPPEPHRLETGKGGQAFSARSLRSPLAGVSPEKGHRGVAAGTPGAALIQSCLLWSPAEGAREPAHSPRGTGAIPRPRG